MLLLQPAAQFVKELVVGQRHHHACLDRRVCKVVGENTFLDLAIVDSLVQFLERVLVSTRIVGGRVVEVGGSVDDSTYNPSISSSVRAMIPSSNSSSASLDVGSFLVSARHD